MSEFEIIDYTALLQHMDSALESMYSLQFLTTVITATVLLTMWAYYILKKFF